MNIKSLNIAISLALLGSVPYGIAKPTMADYRTYFKYEKTNPISFKSRALWVDEWETTEYAELAGWFKNENKPVPKELKQLRDNVRAGRIVPVKITAKNNLTAAVSSDMGMNLRINDLYSDTSDFHAFMKKIATHTVAIPMTKEHSLWSCLGDMHTIDNDEMNLKSTAQDIEECLPYLMNHVCDDDCCTNHDTNNTFYPLSSISIIFYVPNNNPAYLNENRDLFCGKVEVYANNYDSIPEVLPFIRVEYDNMADNNQSQQYTYDNNYEPVDWAKAAQAALNANK